MSEVIQKKLEELSLLLVMIDPSDKDGMEVIKLSFDQLGEEINKASDETFSQQEYSSICNKISQGPTPKIHSLLTSFVSSMQKYFSNPTRTQLAATNNKEFQPQDTGINFDADFLAEFIEKHSLLLQDLEGAVLDYRNKDNSANGSEAKEFSAFVKAYLHNIKGDAGSIGLTGIELATHRFETILSKTSPTLLLSQIIAYKEWVSSCLQAYAAKKALPQLAESFISELDKHCDADIQVLAVEENPKMNASAATDDSYQISSDVSLLVEFTVEAEDHLNAVEEILVNSGSNQLSSADVDTIFRAVHSIKGASSYFNLQETNKTSHLLENLYDEVRDSKRALSPELINLTLVYIDLQKKLLTSAKEATQHGGVMKRSSEVAEYLAKIQEFSGAKPAEPTIKATDQQNLPATPEASSSPTMQAVIPKEDSKKDSLAIKNYVKVDTERLDRLIEAIGEMVIYSSMLIQNARELSGNNEKLNKITHQVEKFSRDLQDIGMSMRLDPIKGLFQKMSRLVWDMSKKLHKEVTLTMNGEDTELDRTVIEKLADPLMHMVRNSLDHGIESKEERVAKGKPPIGSVHLDASHAGGNIVITIADDGRGLDADKLRQKAIEKGLIQDSQLLTTQEIFHLIFHPGFSTAEKVTDISGRGVGMDVVRNNIESMRGQVTIDSELGRGTTFTIELPLTLAIIDGIEILVGPEHFIIPTLSILEFMKADKNMLSSTNGYAENFSFRGKFLPLYRVSKLYNITPKYTDITEGLVVVVESGREQLALFIDDIVGTCQTVIKSLGRMFEDELGLAGCAIMPDGDIGLILDVRTLSQLVKKEYYQGHPLGDLGKLKLKFS